KGLCDAGERAIDVAKQRGRIGVRLEAPAVAVGRHYDRQPWLAARHAVGDHAAVIGELPAYAQRAGGLGDRAADIGAGPVQRQGGGRHLQIGGAGPQEAGVGIERPGQAGAFRRFTRDRRSLVLEGSHETTEIEYVDSSSRIAYQSIASDSNTPKPCISVE